MIDQAFAEGQVKRLAGKKGFPFSQPEAELEMARIAYEYSISTIHLRETISFLSEEWDRCPEPAELKRVLRERAPHQSERCSLCNGSGWLHGIEFGNAQPFSRRCSCSLGREFEEKDQARTHELAKRGLLTWMTH